MTDTNIPLDRKRNWQQVQNIPISNKQNNSQFDDIRNLPNNVNNANYEGLVDPPITGKGKRPIGTEDITDNSINDDNITLLKDKPLERRQNLIGQTSIIPSDYGQNNKLNNYKELGRKPLGEVGQNTLQAPNTPILRQGVGDALKLGYNNVKDKFKKVTGIGNKGEDGGGGLPLGIGYDLTRGIMKTINPDVENYQNVSVTPTNPQLMNYDQAKVDINTQTANTNEAAKNAPNMASYLAMRMGSDNAAAGQVANVAQQTENTNVGIKNNAQAQNAQAMNQASTQNAAINNQAHVDTDQNKANAMNITQGALANWDTVRSVRSRDKKADDMQMMIANTLGTKDYGFNINKQDITKSEFWINNKLGQKISLKPNENGTYTDYNTGQTYNLQQLTDMAKDKTTTTQTTNTTTTQPVNTN